jgi:hypothetical protein
MDFDLKKKKIIKWIIAVLVVVGGAMALFVWRLNNYPSDMESMPVLHALSDGFFIIGMLCTGFGLIMWISTTGVLDIISYGFKSILYLFTPLTKDRDEGGFYEYKLEKQAKRKEVPFEYLWLGVGALVLSIIFAMFV